MDASIMAMINNSSYKSLPATCRRLHMNCRETVTELQPKQISRNPERVD